MSAERPRPAAQTPLAGKGLSFADPVASGGYRWWYVDAFNAEKTAGMTLIAFVGSVFSPYYATARRHPPADPENHVSLNAIFYGPDRKRWALTERGRPELRREADLFQVGPSQISLADNVLTFEIDEWCVPIPSRLRGVVRVRMRHQNAECLPLDDQGLHRWWPVSPVCDVAVELEKPGLSWQGTGYLDSNGGTVALESSFRNWHWMRVHRRDETGTVYYDSQLLDGAWRGLCLQHGDDGRVLSVTQDSEPALDNLPPTTVWRMGRAVRSAALPGSASTQITTFEDTPFYARSALSPSVQTDISSVMHESLDLERFSSRWVQTLLPFRMPRRAGW